ncbi:MAG: DUF2071 domain-containing protein [Gemmataceae bacterium]
MRIPVIRGVIERRLLVNYRVDPAALAKLLPPPFRPKLVGDYGMAGICLIRLSGIRPTFWPAWLGNIRSENAAHRVAVLWDEGGTVREGVYIRRRDSNSRLNALVGGRLFPGVHHHARFDVHETGEEFSVALHSDDGATHVSVSGRVATSLPPTSVFRSLEEASTFFRAGSLGYSATRHPGRFQGMELRCPDWHVEPLAVEAVSSSFFNAPALFPPGSCAFDCALLMRNLRHEWHGQPDLCYADVAQAA